MIQDIIDRLSKSDIVSLDDKTLDKIDKITNNNYSSSQEAVTQIINHAYTLYTNGAFKLPTVDCLKNTGIRNYSDLSSSDKEHLTIEIVKLHKENISIDKIASKLNISKTAANRLLKPTLNKGYERLRDKQKTHIKKIIRQQYIPRYKTKAEMVEMLKISPKAFTKLHKEVLATLESSKQNIDIDIDIDIDADTEINYKTYIELTHSERDFARNFILSKCIHKNYIKTEILKKLQISAEAFKQLYKEALDDSKTLNKQEFLQNEQYYKDAICKILYDSGAVSIEYLANTLKITEFKARKLLADLTPDGEPYILETAGKDFKERKTAEILKYKRLEIFSDEEIMKKLNLNERQYKAFLESLYN